MRRVPEIALTLAILSALATASCTGETATAHAETAAPVPGSGAAPVGEEMLVDLSERLGSAIQSELQTLFENAARGGSDEAIARKKKDFDAIRSWSQADFAALWRNREDWRGRTALDALRELTVSLGLTLDAGEHAGALSGEVTSDLRGLSRLEAIERIAVEKGLHPVLPDVSAMARAASPRPGLPDAFQSALEERFGEAVRGRIDQSTGDPSPGPAPDAVSLVAGPRPFPVTFAGPFVVSVGDVVERVPHGTGTVDVVVRAYGIDPGLLAVLGDVMESIRFENVADAAGRSLARDENARYFGGGLSARGAFESVTRVRLEGLLREVETIHRIVGVHVFPLPESVEIIDVKSVAKHAEAHAGALRAVVVEGGGSSTTFELTGLPAPFDSLIIRAWPYDAAGKSLGTLYQGTTSWRRDRVRFQVQTPEPPARVTLKIISSRRDVEYPFELRDVPLPRHAEQPERLEPIDFAGRDVPVEVTLLGVDRSDQGLPELRLRVDNHANKAIESALVRIFYLGTGGETLSDFPQNLTGSNTAPGQDLLVADGSRTDAQAPAFFMPDGAVSARIAVEQLEFVDGTVWSP